MSDRLKLELFRSCDCGRNVEDENVQKRYKYTPLGWLFWSMGTTAVPKEITFACQQCEKVFEILRERGLVMHYELYKRK